MVSVVIVKTVNPRKPSGSKPTTEMNIKSLLQVGKLSWAHNMKSGMLALNVLREFVSEKNMWAVKLATYMTLRNIRLHYGLKFGAVTNVNCVGHVETDEVEGAANPLYGGVRNSER